MRRLRRPTTDERVQDEKHDAKRAAECPECESAGLVESGAGSEIVCGECGLVIEDEQIDPGPEWRAFNHQERQQKSRVGAPTTETMHDKGLTTQIDWRDKDAYGRSLSS